MAKASLNGGLMVAVLCLAGAQAVAQEVVHALTGMVTAINPTARTIQVKTYDDSEGLFRVQAVTTVSMDFASKVKAETVPAKDFSKNGANVLMYYIGDSAARTAVAVQDLGPGPLGKTKGTFVKMNKHQHTLTIKDDAGAAEDFLIDDKTVAEGTEGVTPGDKYSADKGDGVWVISKMDNGKKVALFVRAR